MNSQKIINYSLIGIIIILFFAPLPVPVENQEGAKDKDNYIYGGIYWTSIFEQVSFNNYIPLGLLIIPFIFIFINNNKKREDNPKE